MEGVGTRQYHTTPSHSAKEIQFTPSKQSERQKGALLESEVHFMKSKLVTRIVFLEVIFRLKGLFHLSNY